jgi:hypothetical protein
MAEPVLPEGREAMTKPWEETWRIWCDEYPHVVWFGDAAGEACFEGGDDEDQDAGRARLAACAPEMARLLLAREFCGREHDCAECLAEPHESHAADCAWLALMRKAGVR